MQAAYCALHARGWPTAMRSGAAMRLVGGLYGVRLGAVFFGESMFSRRARMPPRRHSPDWSQRSPVLGIELIDCQLPSAHLRSLGSRPMPRREFLAILAERAQSDAG